jgi:hypothetical protein
MNFQRIMTRIILVLALLPAPMMAQSSTAPTIQSTEAGISSQPTYPLDEVLIQVNLAINDYQLLAEKSQKDTSPGAIKLPRLKSANFDFKTTNDSSVGPTFSFLIFTIGGSRSTESVNDVSFQYQVPDGFLVPKSTGYTKDGKPILLRESLSKTIMAAANTIYAAPLFQNLPFKELTVTISYGVKWDAKGGATVPMLVTSGFNFEKSKNAVQTVKLTFDEVPGDAH